jgi:hypothetical protein
MKGGPTYAGLWTQDFHQLLAQYRPAYVGLLVAQCNFAFDFGSSFRERSVPGCNHPTPDSLYRSDPQSGCSKLVLAAIICHALGENDLDPEGLASRQPVWILCCRDVPQVCVVVDPQPWSLKMESDRSLLASVRDDGFKQLRICVWV